MEEKPVGSVATASSAPPASAETASSRRRAGGHKRKANAFSTSSNSSTPAKRLTREKAAISQSPILNGGPLTRARQSPNSLASLASSTAADFKLQEKLASAALESASVAAAKEELAKLEELKASIEADFGVIRSRESNVHVVPNHCGWFSWTKIHPLEERILPSFFNGKSQIRTPDAYVEIRNWIVKKFHKNPNVQIESKDLLELKVADADARQEVLEFLDYWGLINFHPFLQLDSSASNNDHGMAEKKLSLEKLFRFENIQSSTPVVSKPNFSSPALAFRLFPESSVAEELLHPEEPSVEYHCNSCSADCSRKRYHCQKQADYDLCTDCFTSRKFASTISSSDFILMEPAEAPGLSSGKWTDQETLLLLEGIELYKENWNEIAEHVATKSKAQCVLHFVQMPIEDVFFDEDDALVAPSREPTGLPAAVDDSSAVPRDGTETSEDKIAATEDQPETSLVEAPKPENASDGNQESVKLDSMRQTVIEEEKEKHKSEVKATQETCDDFAHKALTDAFEGVGYLPTAENKLSFAEVGNPVMALAAFLGNLVESDVATASALTSLKSLESDSPGMQLATRHCFRLEDPPHAQKGLAGLDGTTEMAQDARKDNQDSLTQKGGDSTVVADGGDVLNDNTTEDDNYSLEKKSQPDSSNEDVIEKVIPATHEAASVAFASEEVKPGEVKSSESELQKDPQTCSKKESNEKSTLSGKANSQPTDVFKDVDMVSDSISSHNMETRQSVMSVSAEEPSQAADASKDAADLVSDQGEGIKDYKNEKPDCKDDLNEGHDIQKVKRAAVSALSAAAVKAKVLANQEEDQIRQLAASLIEKQLHKLEMKATFFNEMDNVIMRVREQLDRSRQKLFQERALIIAARNGMPRPMPTTSPANRIATNFANPVSRHPMSIPSQRQPIMRPMGTMPQNPANPFVSTATAGNPVRPFGQETK